MWLARLPDGICSGALNGLPWLWPSEEAARQHGTPVRARLVLVDEEAAPQGPSAEASARAEFGDDVPKVFGVAAPPISKPKTVPCGICGESTQMTGTKRCDSCYEIERRTDTETAIKFRGKKRPAPPADEIALLRECVLGLASALWMNEVANGREASALLRRCDEIVAKLTEEADRDA